MEAQLSQHEKFRQQKFLVLIHTNKDENHVKLITKWGYKNKLAILQFWSIEFVSSLLQETLKVFGFFFDLGLFKTRSLTKVLGFFGFFKNLIHITLFPFIRDTFSF
jgi:hypothetical protein